MSVGRLTAGIALTLAPFLAPIAAGAQEYPARPVRIVTAAPGGGNDFLARIIAPGLTSAVGQQVIVDNRAGRLVGSIVARSAPDGYTLAVGGGVLQFLPLTEKVGYDVLADFAPISQLERSPNVLVVNPSLKVSTVSELIALARAKPGALLYGTGGTGASLHLAGEMFMISAKVKITRVPYKSTGPALLGLLTNEVHMVFTTAGGAMPHIKDGRLKALGVTTAQPSPVVPGVPTLASQGLRDYDLDTISFILAPAKTPAPIINRLNRHVVQVMSQGDVKERMTAGGSEVVTGTPEQLAAKLKFDDTRMRKLFKDIGLSLD